MKLTITKVLVANRGEIARRVFRTCREMGIATVAVHSEPDATEPHAREADEAVALAGSSPLDTYLNAEAVLTAARSTGADAIHPGYGFLAENADFARAVEAAGLVWIGPSPEAIEVMGSKLESKKLMQTSGVPILESIELDGDVDAASSAESIGYPVLIKASAGGGGKGMRIVEQSDDLLDAIESARREAASAFGDDTVFVERFLEEPRHLEIQVFGDTSGNVVSYFERECSIQRRHQKIIEESPSPAIDSTTRAEMGEAAVKAAAAVSYVGAGTVEFLYHDGRFFFLEMNTRLQVEHPVTEMVTGLDLVRLQIEVAQGQAVPDPPGSTTGHAIEARLYAEDPLNDFLPVTGAFHRFFFEDEPGLRVDAGIADDSTVTVHYDPMIAKVIFHAQTREAAARGLAGALRRAHIHGSTTNRSLLVRVLESAEFVAGDTDTGLLERNDISSLAAPLATDRDERLAAVASAIADQAEERSRAAVLPSIPSGWRNSPSQGQRRGYSGSHGDHLIEYRSHGTEFEDQVLGAVTATVATPARVRLSVGGEQHDLLVARHATKRYVDSAHVPVVLEAIPRFPDIGLDDDPGSLHSPMPGKLIRVDAKPGQRVTEGELLVVLEAMKMEHTLRAPQTGTVTEVRFGAGDQVEADAVLVVVDPD